MAPAAYRSRKDLVGPSSKLPRICDRDRPFAPYLADSGGEFTGLLCLQFEKRRSGALGTPRDLVVSHRGLGSPGIGGLRRLAQASAAFTESGCLSLVGSKRRPLLLDAQRPPVGGRLLRREGPPNYAWGPPYLWALVVSRLFGFDGKLVPRRGGEWFVRRSSTSGAKTPTVS